MIGRRVDGQADRHRTIAEYRAGIVSRGKTVRWDLFKFFLSK